MKDIIIKYIIDNYDFKLSTYETYKFFDKSKKQDVSVLKVYSAINTIFNLSQEEINEIMIPWMKIEQDKLQNKVEIVRAKVYERNGINLNLAIDDLNKLIEMEFKGK